MADDHHPIVPPPPQQATEHVVSSHDTVSLFADGSATVNLQEPLSNPEDAKLRSQLSNLGEDFDDGRQSVSAPPQFVIDAIRHAEPIIRSLACHVLGHFGTVAKPHLSLLANALADPDELVRVCAARAVWRIGGQADPTARICADIIKNGNLARARWCAASCIAEIGPDAVESAGQLVEWLASEAADDLTSRGEVSAALQAIGPALTEQIPKLVALLRHRNPNIQIEAAQVLGAIGPKALPASRVLKSLLKTQDPSGRVTFAAALWNITQKPVDVLDTLISILRQTSPDGPHQILQPATRILCEAAVRHKVLVTSSLTKALRGADWQSFNLVIALSAIEPENELAIRLAAESVPRLREQAIKVLKTAGSQGRVAVPILARQLLEVDWPKPTIWALSALRDTARPAIPQLLELFDRKLSTDAMTKDVRLEACKALWDIARLAYYPAIGELYRGLQSHTGSNFDEIRKDDLERLLRAIADELPTESLTSPLNSGNLTPLPRNEAPSSDRQNGVPHATADSLERELELVQTQIGTKIDSWLATLEGTKFESEHAQLRVEEIKRLVARAGRELLFGGQSVTLYCTVRPSRKHARIDVTTIGADPQQTLWAKVELPRLTTRPIRSA